MVLCQLLWRLWSGRKHTRSLYRHFGFFFELGWGKPLRLFLEKRTSHPWGSSGLNLSSMCRGGAPGEVGGDDLCQHRGVSLWLASPCPDLYVTLCLDTAVSADIRCVVTDKMICLYFRLVFTMSVFTQPWVEGDSVVTTWPNCDGCPVRTF